MRLEYDAKEDFFWLDGQELNWSSLYVLSKGEVSKAKLIKDMQVSKSELTILEHELRDLKDMGLITKTSGAVIKPTKAGLRVLDKAHSLMPVTAMKSKAIRDIDKVQNEYQRLMKMPLSKMRSLFPYSSEVEHKLDVPDFLIHVFLGSMVFNWVVAITFSVLALHSFDQFIQLFILAPVVSMFVTIAVVVYSGVTYSVGDFINSFIFRKK